MLFFFNPTDNNKLTGVVFFVLFYPREGASGSGEGRTTKGLSSAFEKCMQKFE